MPGPEPLRPVPWRRHLRDLARVVLLVIAVSLVSGATVLVMSRQRPQPAHCASAQATPDCTEQKWMTA